MKDIKFRAWNSVDKMFIEWSTLKASPVLFMNILKSKTKHTELIQFTGIKDGNGVEICKGDVIANLANPRQKLVVKSVIGYSGFCVEIYEDWFVQITSEYVTENELVVIGNIHQNPELSEQK